MSTRPTQSQAFRLISDVQQDLDVLVQPVAARLNRTILLHHVLVTHLVTPRLHGGPSRHDAGSVSKEVLSARPRVDASNVDKVDERRIDQVTSSQPRYGRFYKSMLYPLLRRINEHLMRWAMRKYERLRRREQRARELLAAASRRSPQLFAHWRFGLKPDGWTMGAR
jgi:hypothetical protein